MGTAQTLSRGMSVRESSSEHWDDAEFRAVFVQRYSQIVGILMRLLGDHSGAEEIANEVFLRLYRRPGLQIDGNVGGWLYRAATNLGIDALRRSSRRRKYEQGSGQAVDEGTQTDPLNDLLRQEKCQSVRVVLALLKSAHAQLLILRASGLSYRELAETLEVKMSGIGTMLNRAEEEFRLRYLELYPMREEL